MLSHSTLITSSTSSRYLTSSRTNHCVSPANHLFSSLEIVSNLYFFASTGLATCHGHCSEINGIQIVVLPANQQQAVGQICSTSSLAHNLEQCVRLVAKAATGGAKVMPASSSGPP